MSDGAQDIPTSSPPAWAHEIGVLSLGPVSEVPSSLAEIADRMLIQETASRYALAYDERRLDVLADVFAEDVTFAYSISGGGYGESKGRETVIAWLHEIMQGQTDQRRHVCANFVVEELAADRAVVTTYLALFASDTETRLVTTGFYRMELCKSDGKWRLSYVYDGLDRPF
ncbi:nuclear transport factor 2 family protein [Streptomyces canus]|uniref:nuclear transport factor 2 family protein n=1 Tax=Streptomyces canus TaxID=58343 RepID=UPI003715D202